MNAAQVGLSGCSHRLSSPPIFRKTVSFPRAVLILSFHNGITVASSSRTPLSIHVTRPFSTNTLLTRVFNGVFSSSLTREFSLINRILFQRSFRWSSIEAQAFVCWPFHLISHPAYSLKKQQPDLDNRYKNENVEPVNALRFKRLIVFVFFLVVVVVPAF